VRHARSRGLIVAGSLLLAAEALGAPKTKSRPKSAYAPAPSLPVVKLSPDGPGAMDGVNVDDDDEAEFDTPAPRKQQTLPPPSPARAHASIPAPTVGVVTSSSALAFKRDPKKVALLLSQPLSSPTALWHAEGHAGLPPPARSPEPRALEGRAADGLAWRVRPYRIPVGIWPKAIRIDRDGRFAYVTNFDSQSVSVIDLATQQVARTVDLGDNAVEADFSADGKQLYVSGWLHAGFYTLDLASFVATKIPVGTKPKGVRTSPDGRWIYVCNWGSDTVSVVDIATQAVAATIPVGSVPRWIALTSGGDTGLVANFEGRSISVLNLNIRKEVARIRGIDNPRHIVISRDDRTAYVTDREAGKLRAIDLAKRKVVWSVAVGARPKTVFLSPDERFAYTANYGSNDVGVVDLASRRLVATIPAGLSPSGLELSPDGRSIYVTNWWSFDVTVIDVAEPGAPALADAPPPSPPGSRPIELWTPPSKRARAVAAKAP